MSGDFRPWAAREAVLGGLHAAAISLCKTRLDIGSDLTVSTGEIALGKQSVVVLVVVVVRRVWRDVNSPA